MSDSVDKPLSASQTVLDETPARVLTFLRGVAAMPMAHGLLQDAGFTSDEYHLGWKLLHAAAGYKPESAKAPSRTAAILAMETLDAWDEDGMRRIRSTLMRLHKPQAAFVFAGDLRASSGPAAALGVGVLLERLEQLDSGKDREATREADHAALKTLAARGFDATELARLKALVVSAQSIGVAEPAPKGDSGEALSELYDWYKDWAETARAVVKKPIYLMGLGLLKRRTKKKDLTATPESVEGSSKVPVPA